MKKNKKLLYLFIFVISFCFIGNVRAVYNDSMVGNYEEELAKFPNSYQEKIKELHKIYPNAIFVVQNKFFDWNKYKEIEVSWNDMLKAELDKGRSLIWYTAKSEYKGNAYNKEKTWYYATEKAVTYYMNPYNFLDETHIFMFESQYFNSSETVEGIDKILSTYYKGKECPESDGKTYAQVILEAAKENNVSAYMLASRLKQENGTGTSALITGKCLEDSENCQKYYNFYNVQATGNSNEEVINNGIKCAAGKIKGCEGFSWTSPYLSIRGGAKFIYKKYIGINDTYNVKGQMTNYLQKWDPYGPNLGGHQYMQNITAPYTESESTYNSNITYKGVNHKYVFYIPIYQNMPNVKEENNNTTSDDITKLITYNISDNYISGIQEKTLQADFIKSITDKLNNSKVSIRKNDTNKTENIATGDIIKIEYNGKEFTYTAIIYGDINGDSVINSADLLKMRQHLIPTNELKGVYLISANLNRNDTVVNSADLLKMRQHLIGLSKINQ